MYALYPLCPTNHIYSSISSRCLPNVIWLSWQNKQTNKKLNENIPRRLLKDFLSLLSLFKTFKSQNMKRSWITDLRMLFLLYQDKNNPLQGSAKTDPNVDLLLSSPCLNTYGWEKKLLEGREELEMFLNGESILSSYIKCVSIKFHSGRGRHSSIAWIQTCLGIWINTLIESDDFSLPSRTLCISHTKF